MEALSKIDLATDLLLANYPPLRFPQFPHLPSEIRHLVWKQALPGPRLIHLQHYLTRDDQVPADEEIYNLGFRTRSTIPLASVCRESRDIVEEIYTLAFGTEFSSARTWFDFKRDTLYLNWDQDVVSGLPPWESNYEIEDLDEDIKKVTNLAVFAGRLPKRSGFQMPGGAGRFSLWIARILEQFGSIKELTLVDREDGIQNETDLVMMNESGIAALIELFEGTTSYNPALDNLRSELERQFMTERLYLNSNLHLDVLESYRIIGTQQRSFLAPLFSKCSISWQGITNRSLYERYKTSLQHFEKMKEDYRINLLLKADLNLSITVSVRESTPLSEIVEEYISTAKISNKLVFHAVSSDAVGGMDPRLTLRDYGVGTGSTLELWFCDKTE
jgi:hypothetical protein